jgi:hypothetical protein
MKFALLAVATTCLFFLPHQAFAQGRSSPPGPPNPSCPIIDGLWTRPTQSTNETHLNIQQNGCQLTGQYQGYFQGFGDWQVYIASVIWDDQNQLYRFRGSHEVYHMGEPNKGCTTEIYGSFSNITATTMDGRIEGTDGHCSFPTTFTELSHWTRVQ